MNRINMRFERIFHRSRLFLWFARLWSILSIVLIIGFIIGEGVHLNSINEWFSFLFFPIGISIGMIIAWFKEGIGGCITVSSLLIFYLIYYLTSNSFPKGLGWLLFSMPGVLFMIYWFLSRKKITN